MPARAISQELIEVDSSAPFLTDGQARREIGLYIAVWRLRPRDARARLVRDALPFRRAGLGSAAASSLRRKRTTGAPSAPSDSIDARGEFAAAGELDRVLRDDASYPGSALTGELIPLRSDEGGAGADGRSLQPPPHCPPVGEIQLSPAPRTSMGSPKDALGPKPKSRPVGERNTRRRVVAVPA